MTGVGAAGPTWQQVEYLDAVAHGLLERGWVVRTPRRLPGEAQALAVSTAAFDAGMSVAVDPDHHLVLRTSTGPVASVLDVPALHAALQARLRHPERVRQSPGRPAGRRSA